MQRRRKRPPFAKRRSGIHGHGVFATRRIRAGQLLISYVGQLLDEGAGPRALQRRRRRRSVHAALPSRGRSLHRRRRGRERRAVHQPLVRSELRPGTAGRGDLDPGDQEHPAGSRVDVRLLARDSRRARRASAGSSIRVVAARRNAGERCWAGAARGGGDRDYAGLIGCARAETMPPPALRKTAFQDPWLRRLRDAADPCRPAADRLPGGDPHGSGGRSALRRAGRGRSAHDALPRRGGSVHRRLGRRQRRAVHQSLVRAELRDRGGGWGRSGSGRSGTSSRGSS